MNRFIQYEENGGIYFRSENIALEHAFGTKHGSIERDGLILLHQVHSANVLYVTADDRGRCFSGYDAIVTNFADVPIAVKSADCVPILFCDPINSVIGACHAGWRGTISGVAENTVGEMIHHGADISQIQVAVGAAAQFCCYEIKEDFREAVKNAQGTEFCDMFVRPAGISGQGYCSNADHGALHADVPSMNVYMLLRAGIARENISVSTHCTICECDIFHSFRASGLKETMRSFITI